MGRLLWLAAALGAAGCGKVAAVPDGPPADTLPDAVSCPADQLACGATCADPMTSNDHCGACDVACTAGRATCSAGHCVDFYTSCASIHAHDATAQSGFFTLLDQSTTYCDMEDGGISISALAFDNFNATPPAGYKMVLLADLQAVGTQQAFIALFNKVGGALPVLDGPMDGIGNCGIKISATASTGLALNGSLVVPATTGAAGPISCTASYTVGTLSFAVESQPTFFAGTTLAPDFFTTYPATEVTGGEGNNPAFFWTKVMP